MPVVFRYHGYRFFFFCNEGDPREPLHIHIRKAENIAKFWINPEVSLVDSYGFKASELRTLVRIIEQNKDLIREAWHEHFNQ